MSLLGDIVDRVLFPSREIHVVPVLDGAFSPNRRLDQARQLGGEIERPDDLALGPDGALYVSTEDRIFRCAGPDFAQRTFSPHSTALLAGLPGLRMADCSPAFRSWGSWRSPRKGKS